MPTTPPAEVEPAVVDDGDARVLVAGLVDRLHAHTPLRVWSLIVTIFGDTVAPRGGEIWAGTLQELLGAMRIDAAAVRAALSRLARDGWLDRIKVGRLRIRRFSSAAMIGFCAIQPFIWLDLATRNPRKCGSSSTAHCAQPWNL